MKSWCPPLLNPEHALPGALEEALEPHGAHVPDRIELLKEAAVFNRLSVAKVMLKLGPAPQSVLSECIVSLGDNLNSDWLQALRLGGLLLGEKEREPLLTLLARQQPLPKNALQLLLNNGASMAADSEQDSLLNLVSGASHDYAGLPAPQTIEIDLSLLAGCHTLTRQPSTTHAPRRQFAPRAVLGGRICQHRFYRSSVTRIQ